MWTGWEQIREYLIKLTVVTILLFFWMAMKGGDVFASLAGVLHHSVGVIFNQGQIAE
jgi:membrane protein YqaA with SNARE-associated domain